MTDIQRYNGMKFEELQSELLALRKKQFQMRLQKSTGSLEKTHPIKEVRRNIARVKTFMTEKAGKGNV